MTELVPNRAGMVCFNLTGEVLIVTAMADPKTWVLPKGHIEKDETPDQTAKRETEEEAGIVATPLWRVCKSSYIFKNEHVVVEWWAGCAIRKAERLVHEIYNESDWRESRWVSVPEALSLLAFVDLQDAVKLAACYK